MRIVAGALFCALLLPPGLGLTQAQEAYVELSVGERLGFDDNVGLTRGDPVSDFSSQTALGLSFGRTGDTLDLGLRSRFVFTKFFDDGELDSNDQFVVADAGFRSERSRSRLAAEYRRDTTRTSQEDDTGEFLLDNIRQEELSLGPSWSFQATRLDRFAVEAEYRAIDYERRLVDNDRWTAEASWRRDLTGSSAITLSSGFREIDFDTADNRQVRIVELEGDWTSDVTPRLRLSLGGGSYWADLSADPIGAGAVDDDSDSGFVAHAGLRFDLAPDAALTAEYGRMLVPSGSGNVRLRDRLDATFEQDWNQRVSWAVAARYQAQEGLLGSQVADRDFVRVSPSIDWRLARDWTLRAAYRFRWQAFDDQDEDAVSNAVFVTLTFRPERWSLSR